MSTDKKRNIDIEGADKLKYSKNDFRVPENYFDYLENSIQEKAYSQNKDQVFIQPTWVKYGLSFAGILLLILIFVWVQDSSDLNKSTYLSDSEISDYVDSGLIEINDEDLDWVYSEIQIDEDIDTATTTLIYIDYLIDNNVDIEYYYVEL